MVKTEALFSGKQYVYDRHRPNYSEAIIENALQGEENDLTIADIGSGTGYLSVAFSKRGHYVQAIEPNKDLRNAHKQKIADTPEERLTSFHACKAQDTSLSGNSIDFLTLGNVAHWLDSHKKKRLSCLKEFNRIAKPDANLAVISLSPSVKNSWIKDIFKIAKKYDPAFPIPRVMNTFSQHKQNALSFIAQIIHEYCEEFSTTMDKKSFFEFICSHSFCDETMEEEIGAVFDLYAQDQAIQCHFKASTYKGPVIAV